MYQSSYFVGMAQQVPEFRLPSQLWAGWNSARKVPALQAASPDMSVQGEIWRLGLGREEEEGRRGRKWEGGVREGRKKRRDERKEKNETYTVHTFMLVLLRIFNVIFFNRTLWTLQTFFSVDPPKGGSTLGLGLCVCVCLSVCPVQWVK